MSRPADWRYPVWKNEEGDFWFLMQADNLVGEVYRLSDGRIKWHCKTSDWRDLNALSIEQAKAECECSFWKEAWEIAVAPQE